MNNQRESIMFQNFIAVVYAPAELVRSCSTVENLRELSLAHLRAVSWYSSTSVQHLR